ncbi:hypothetical protein ABT009_10495 [Streptomyces sp. NPDC002896]|uniref:hypothetical protein n=1 Tax=Streptomyces sp. NPDC002896 TaxID=3154438 RepID=UPI00332BB15C
MFIAYTITAVLLAVILAASAAATHRRNPQVTASMAAVGVPDKYFSQVPSADLLR